MSTGLGLFYAHILGITYILRSELYFCIAIIQEVLLHTSIEYESNYSPSSYVEIVG